MYKNIYVLVDMRRIDISNSTLDEAFALAKFTGAKLKVKHAVECFSRANLQLTKREFWYED